MSMDIGAYLSGGFSLVQAQKGLRAQIQALRIEDKPENISFTRYEVDLPEQRVRVEWSDSLSDANSDAGTATLRRGYIFGYKDHPTLPDLDIQEWDTFVLYDNQYTVTSVNHHLIGQIQAAFEAL